MNLSYINLGYLDPKYLQMSEEEINDDLSKILANDQDEIISKFYDEGILNIEDRRFRICDTGLAGEVAALYLDIQYEGEEFFICSLLDEHKSLIIFNLLKEADKIIDEYISFDVDNLIKMLRDLQPNVEWFCRLYGPYYSGITLDSLENVKKAYDKLISKNI